MFRRLARYPLLAALCLFAALPAHAGEITVFAAASLKNALEAVTREFETATGHTVRLSFAGSSVLARQIEHGAPADVFISANRDWMDRLESHGLIAPGSRTDLLENRLVLVAHGADMAAFPLADLPAHLGDRRLAMALVDAVPAGIYGKAALTRLGLWQTLAPQVAQTDNVRAALALVALGEAPYGIVYRTDAWAEPRVSVVADFPADSHPPIRYPVAVIAGHDRPETLALLDYLHGPAAAAAFVGQGFSVIGQVKE